MLILEDINVISSAGRALVVVFSHTGEHWWKDANVWTAVGTLLAAGGALWAALVSRASAKASQKSVAIAEKTAELLDKQYQQQLNQKKPLLNFGSMVIINTPDPENRTLRSAPVFYLQSFHIDIDNRRGENISFLSYVWAVATKDEVIAINHAIADLSYSHINKFKISANLPGRPQFHKEDFYIFLFIYAMDASNEFSFTKYGRHITESCFSDPSFILHPIENPDLSSLSNMNATIYEHVTTKLEPDKKKMVSLVLDNDPGFADWIRELKCEDSNIPRKKHHKSWYSIFNLWRCG